MHVLLIIKIPFDCAHSFYIEIEDIFYLRAMML